MSAPPGSRWSRANTRARGSARETARGGSQGRRAPRQSERGGAASSSDRENGSQTYPNPTSNEREHNNVRNRNGTSPNRNGAQVSSAILSHAGPISTPRDQHWRNAAEEDPAAYKQRMSDLYQKLKERRERERKQAIKDGFLADPEKPRSLAHAITPVGTCQDMCPEFERVERIVQLMVDASEKIPSTSDAKIRVPCEELMVKRFRRSAAGYDEQLPSDIRPPQVLLKTLNHLFESVIGERESLANTHKFVWDRTRGIRNDFSIQQVTKIDDLKIAIDCFERIARFHILSLHQLSHPTRDNGEFDHHQEREQLNNTLLSLMYYYDDSRGRLVSPNEAEFRAYCIIFEMQDQRPDLEDRAQNWPRAILNDPRVQTALRLYAAAGNTLDEQGPLRPRTTFSTAQANTRGFFDLVQSNSVSYMMACVAEIYFNLVRSTAIEAIWTAYKKRRPGSAAVEDWGVEDLTYALGFDDFDQTKTFCEEHGLEVGQREYGEDYLKLGSVTGRTLIDHNPRRKQIYSRYIVENKRLRRSLTAVINGLSYLDAKAQDLIDASDKDSMSSGERHFIDVDYDSRRINPHSASLRSKSSEKEEQLNNGNGAISPFRPVSNNDTSSNKPNPFQTSRSAQSQPTPVFTNSGASATSQAFNPFGSKDPPKFDFTAPSNQQSTTKSPDPSQFGHSRAPKFDFTVPSSQQPTTKTPVPSQFGNSEAPKFDFRLAASARKPDENKSEGSSSTNGNPKPSASAPFGGPSIDIDKTARPEFASPFGPSKSTTTQSGVTGSSSLFLPEWPSPETSSNSDQSRVVLEARSGSPKLEATSKPSEKIPKFSFATSSLFQPVTKDTRNDSQPQISNPNIPTESKTSFPAITIQPPDSTSSTSESSLPKPAARDPINVSPAPSKQSFNFISKSPSTTIPPASDSLISKASHPPTPAQEKGALTSNVGGLPQVASFFPSSLTSNPQIQSQTIASASTALSSSSFQSSAIDLPQPRSWAPTKSTVDPRPAALEKVTDGLMFDEGGLLQQYIEISIGPIINSAITQFENEESWKVAREFRLLLLSRKYLRKWKTLAWNLGLKRRGRRQRQNFARSIQNLAKSTKERKQEVGRSSIFDVNRTQKGRPKRMPHEWDLMPGTSSPQKRQSLPAGSRIHMSGAIEMPRNTKRKLDDSEPLDEGRTNRPHVSGHKRSNTVGPSLNPILSTSAPPHPHEHPQSLKRPETSGLTNLLMSNNNITNHARRIAPNTYSDTTQTDYFRLKALGVNPDTTIVPLTKKRAVASEEDKGVFLTPDRPEKTDVNKIKESKQRSNIQSGKTNVPTSTDDDEFFASIQAIRSTLADSTSWFQNERQSIERSMTPSRASLSPSSGKKETPAERKLREIREKGHTPSRSEVRLRAMGDKSLLPASFWDGERQNGSYRGGQKGKRKSDDWENGKRTDRGKKRRESASENAEIGFATLVIQQSPWNREVGFNGFENEWPHNGMVNGHGQHGNGQVEQFLQNSGDMDEVIELSD